MTRMTLAWGVIVAAGGLFFLDAPFRTFRRGYVEARHRARLVLLSLELDLLALGVLARVVLHWRAPLAPPALAPALGALGLALSAAGVVLGVWAKLRLGRGFNATFGIRKDHVLVTDGPYRVTRHPIYTGILVTLAGGALVQNDALALLVAGLFALPFFFHTVYEESLFERHFGAAYFEYERRVPRLSPWPRPRPAPESAPRPEP